MPSELIVMDHTGDTKTIWDADNADEVEVAREQFDRLREKGYSAFRVDKKGEKGAPMKEFDPTAEKMILIPMLRGG